MKHKVITLAAVICAAAATCAVRYWQLQVGYDAGGLPIGGALSTYLLAALSAVCVVGMFLLVRPMEQRERYYNNLFITPTGVVLSILGGVGIGLYAIFTIVGANTITDLMTAHGVVDTMTLIESLLAIVSAVCILLNQHRMAYMHRPKVFLYLLPFAFIVLVLIATFRSVWSGDPIILDYCFYLFAMVSAMCAVYHAMGFCFDRGLRRRTTFWCLLTFYFCAVGLVSAGSIHELLLYGGLGLWALSLCVPLLTDVVPHYILPPEHLEAEAEARAAAVPQAPELEQASDEDEAAETDDDE